MERLLPWLATCHAVYYALTGVWPLVSIRTFMAVTGPKTDVWLVKTVGLLVTAIGAAIGVAAWGGRFTPEVFVLAVGSAAALGAIDVYYHGRGVIARIYLLDAAAEALIVVGWFVLRFSAPG